MKGQRGGRAKGLQERVRETSARKGKEEEARNVLINLIVKAHSKAVLITVLDLIS